MVGTNGNRIAKGIGGTLARVQHMVDHIAMWGFRAVRKAGGTPEQKKGIMPKTRLGLLVRTGRLLLSFIGEAGEAYYQRYNELKDHEK